jgi:hypothetical protein
LTVQAMLSVHGRRGLAKQTPRKQRSTPSQNAPLSQSASSTHSGGAISPPAAPPVAPP